MLSTSAWLLGLAGVALAVNISQGFEHFAQDHPNERQAVLRSNQTKGLALTPACKNAAPLHKCIIFVS